MLYRQCHIVASLVPACPDSSNCCTEVFTVGYRPVGLVGPSLHRYPSFLVHSMSKVAIKISGLHLGNKREQIPFGSFIANSKIAYHLVWVEIKQGYEVSLVHL